jgi:hypothetical protein
MDSTKKIFNYIPKYAIKPLILCVIFNFTVYSGVRLFYTQRIFHNLTTYYDNNLLWKLYFLDYKLYINQ